MARQRVKGLDGAVLIADDHAVVRHGVVHLLRKELGVREFREADTFPEALDELSRRKFALAVFDIDMPGLDSPSGLVEVRKQFPDVRVVVLSGFSDRQRILAALEAGVHGYLIKTDPMDTLIEHLHYVLSGEIYVPATLAHQPCLSPAPRPQEVATRAALAQPLSDRQRQVLEGLVMGLSNKQIARELKLAEGTVKMHIGALFRALGANNRAHAAALGKRLLD